VGNLGVPGRIRNRSLLVVLVCAAQLLCLLVGALWFSALAERRLAAHLQQQCQRELESLASAAAAAISTDALGGSPGAEACVDDAANALDRFEPPIGGFLALVDAQTGEVLRETRGRGPSEGESSIAPGGSLLELDSVVDAGNPVALGARGFAGDDVAVSIRSIPALSALLVTARPQRNAAQAAARVAALIRTGGLLTALFVALVGGLLTASIVRRYENRLAGINSDLQQLVQQRSESLLNTRDAIIFGLAKLAESRDDDTGQHLDRIRDYVRILATELQATHPAIDAGYIANLELASSLHDVGKVGIPDQVLLKDGPLTPAEREIIERHPLIGGDCLRAIEDRLGDDDFLETACEIAFAHHERWDGSGYPFGLRGEQIPLPARIVALADVYDALTTDRAYKTAMTHEQARNVILAASGTHFDPVIVRCFILAEAKFMSTAAHFACVTPSRRKPVFNPDRFATGVTQPA
jgi:HD-GYP domain-containing protein (c-di-GMP phosphodiesterase class II)